MESNGSDGRCFGHYRCKKCGNSWPSAYCWPGEYQHCKRCNNQVYAHQTRPLTNPELDKYEPLKLHRTDLCGKCKKQGYNCQM